MGRPMAFLNSNNTSTRVPSRCTTESLVTHRGTATRIEGYPGIRVPEHRYDRRGFTIELFQIGIWIWGKVGTWVHGYNVVSLFCSKLPSRV
eukprot:3830269-Rhodomonas_salina.1